MLRLPFKTSATSKTEERGGASTIAAHPGAKYWLNAFVPAKLRFHRRALKGSNPNSLLVVDQVFRRMFGN
jgi:hypothetical protein